MLLLGIIFMCLMLTFGATQDVTTSTDSGKLKCILDHEKV